MDRGELDSERRIDQVKSTTDLFGERTIEGNSKLKKHQTGFSERSSSRTRELHMARRDIGRFNESRSSAESIKARAESELFVAKNTVRDLASRIEEVNLKTEGNMERGKEEWALDIRKVAQSAEVMRDLEYVKKEVSKLKLDMASVLDEKNRAEKETEASNSKISWYLTTAEALQKEIEKVNEEQVLVELARIEAVKEIGAIEAQRKEEADRFSSEMETTRKKMNEIIQEINSSKETELKLAATNFDVTVLQNELKLAYEMDRRVQRSESFRQREVSFRKGKGLDSKLELQFVTEELETAKMELALIREDSFQIMASLDVIREELKHTSQQVSRLKKKENKTDVIVQNLNSKLLRAKAKLEAVSAAEEKANTIVSNLSLALEQLKMEAEAAKKERGLICEETTNIKAEVEKTEFETDSAEERLQAAMQELEAVKSSEATALEKLKTLSENTMRARASASKHSSTITISKFEYEYLTGRAAGTEEIADKKVAAAQAWTEAIKASEKEIIMKTKMNQRKVRELRVQEEQEAYETKKSLAAKKVVEGEARNWRESSAKNSEPENMSWLEGALPRKSMRENSSLTPVRRVKFRKSASPAFRHLAKSGSFKAKRRRKVIPNLAKLFTKKGMESDHCVL
ncbi:protein PLASTID MOVEMENT IMPAIRED 2 [Rhododendron vialii]|uniref:protein PLASTID MOVEMENT IMPAIRED 2 n=1 Tax=Rhododendron vialii TaxID=182163 RepID=UPI00265FF57C|nr:protein PLASTID MOVEMENT IMPAIRED 2 [Rhododendron vialii]XP_058185261.1 protein PLASTID MOVEMENT IMPAIRED 2 [Rhododendron vialii]XP_058185262.1 protein PLASTID MOVEMENT IMPAIRED 2 [Rhododendron vialii]